VVLVVLCVLVVFGAGVLAVDAGSLWVERRTLTTGTDAVALAAAHSYATGTGAAYRCGNPTLQELLEQNAPGASIESCLPVSTGSDSGYVAVDTRSRTVEASFGKAFGIGDEYVTASSSAMWGSADSVAGLRPIALCAQHPAVQAILADANDPSVTSVHRVSFQTSGGPPCGPVGAWIDFDGTAGPGQINVWLQQGYPGEIHVGSCATEGAPDDGCTGGTTANLGNSPAPGLQYLRANEVPFGVVLFNEMTPDQQYYKVRGFLGVVLRDFRLTGGERYLDLEFRRVSLDGECCAQDAIGAGVNKIRLCSVDTDSEGPEVRCDLS
jgi:hypothetical protein